MNLRQKAKHYKRLAELYGSKTIQPHITYQEFGTIHLQNICYFNTDTDDAGVIIKMSNDRLLKSVRDMIVTEVIDDYATGKKMVKSDIWVVDRR